MKYRVFPYKTMVFTMKNLGFSGEQKKSTVKTNPSNDPAKWGVRIFRFSVAGHLAPGPGLQQM